MARKHFPRHPPRTPLLRHPTMSAVRGVLQLRQSLPTVFLLLRVKTRRVLEADKPGVLRLKPRPLLRS